MTVFSDIQPHRITEDAHCKPARSCYKHIDNNENSKRTGMGNLKKKKKSTKPSQTSWQGFTCPQHFKTVSRYEKTTVLPGNKINER